MVRPIRLRTTLAALAALTVLAATASGASASAAPAGFFGLSGWTTPTASQAQTLASDGLGLVRVAVGWGQLQPSSSPSSINWSYTDQVAQEAAQNHINIVFDLNGCATWACGSVDAVPSGSELSAYESFVEAMVARYEPSSSFWAGQSYVPSITWQVWNEVNAGVFWPNPTPAAYAQFLEQIGGAVHSVDPAAPVLMSALDGLPANSSGMAIGPFLQGLYQQPGFAQSTVGIAVNAYATDAPSALNVLDQARAVVLQQNDAQMPMWVTEIGWASAGPTSPFTVTEDQQNDYLSEFFGQSLACQSRWNLQHVLWFSLEDQDPSTLGGADYWGYHTGLLDDSGNPKPAYQTFLQFLGSGPLPAGASQCTLPGGQTLDYATPQTTITSAPSVTNNTQSAIVTFTATENGQQVPGMQYQCSLDSAPWSACTSPLNAASTREGDHTLLVRAIDPEGNVDPTPAHTTWVLDLAHPETLITWHLRHVTRHDQMRLRFVGHDPGGMGHFVCRINRGRWTPCASPYTTPPLRKGRYTIYVRAIDAAGNIARYPAWLTFAVGHRR
ncbi:MAG: cellulase family glycosylhydrolase [Solirubrobacteraceae bacterium]|jgi:hypothetical protein